MNEFSRFLVLAKRSNILSRKNLVLAILCSLVSLVDNTAYAEVMGCQVGNTSAYVFPQGYWQMVGAPSQGKCAIPGDPHPDSGFLNGNGGGAFRIEGRYRVDTVLAGGWGFVATPGECPSNSCISGFREWMCTEVYKLNGMYMENSLCIFPNGCPGCPGGKAYACFTDTHVVTLWEWKCYPQPLEPPVKKANFGPSCPVKW